MVSMNNLALKKICPGVQGKLKWPGLCCYLICIEPDFFIIINKVFFAIYFNLEAVASLCAIPFSRSSVFVHIGSIL